MNKSSSQFNFAALIFRALLMLLAMCSLLLVIFFKPVVVDGPSMKNTLLSHDYLIAAKYLTIKPHKGDITLALLDSTRSTPGRLLIKRIVGVPGDKVKITKGQLVVNDMIIEEKYLGSNDSQNIKEIVLKAGEYYLLGDNRQDSIDSRVIGPIKVDELQGRVLYRLMPANRFGAIQ